MFACNGGFVLEKIMGDRKEGVEEDSKCQNKV